MNGSEKQIEYAMSLIQSSIIFEKERQLMIGNPDKLAAKSRDNKTPEQLERRDRMVSEMRSDIEKSNEIIRRLEKMVQNDVYAGDVIDCCKSKYWTYRPTQVGYVNFITLSD